MRKKTTIVGVLVCALTAGTLYATDVRELGGRTFIGDGVSWVQQDPDGATYDVDPRVITIKLRETADRSAELALHDALGGTVLRRARTGFIDIEIPQDQDVFAALDAYTASELVEIAEPNTIGRYTLTPNDPSYGSQWQWPIVDAEDAWDVTGGVPSAVVAVLDSGTEFNHEDLGPGTDGFENVWLNPGEDAWSDPTDPTTGNGVDDDLNGFVDDWKGWNFSTNSNNSSGPFFHGTAVAGMISAKTNNGTGIAAIAGGLNGPGARVLIAGVGNSGPLGSVIDDAVLYAADLGANVIQLSLTVGSSAAIDAAFQMAVDMYNMTIICASGNGGGSSVSYPSSNTNVIAVGATTSTDLRASFSQHGPLVEISAPGASIFTLDLNDGYDTTSGTSFAAPLVSGVVALMLSVNPGLTNTEIRQILHDTADKVGGYNYNWNMAMPGHSFELGYGRVNAKRAIDAAMGATLFADGFESGDATSWALVVP